MRVLLTTDVFPPKCGGSGWSTYYLAEALIDRGHDARVIVPKLNGKAGSRRFGRVNVLEFSHPAPAIPFVRAIAKGPAFYLRFERYLDEQMKGWQPDVIHAQHSMTVPPSVVSGRRNGVPVISTVRDYWPVCYYGTLTRGDEQCNACSLSGAVGCLIGRHGMTGLAGAGLLPLLEADLRHKRRALSASSRVTAVSRYVESKLISFVPEDRLRVVPNGVNVAEIERITGKSPQSAPDTPYLLFVGKLEVIKGAGYLLSAYERLNMKLPLVVVGDGALRSSMEEASRAKGFDIRFTGWLTNEESLRLMARARAILFPSVWPEPLSRVLLEAMSVGAPVVAMNTGGTDDIIEHGRNGLLCTDLEGLVSGVNSVLADEHLRTALSAGAKRKAHDTFDLNVVCTKVEELYREVIR